MPGEDFSFGILGPLEIRRGGSSIQVLPSKQRIVIAALLLRRGRMVSTDDLVHYLWGTEPPKSAKKTLQGYITRLRRVLGNGVIQSHSIGYSIRVGNLDICIFDELMESADSQSDPWKRLALLQDALSLYRGTPLVDILSDELQQTEGALLTERWLAASEQKFDAELEVGRSAEVIAQLRDVVNAYPFHERFWYQLILALYRVGRQADALETYQRARAILAEELGVEPGSRLRELQMKILTDDALLSPPDDTFAGVAENKTGVTIQTEHPAQLPPTVADFFGRDEEIDELGVLLRNGSTNDKICVPTIALSGAGGIGKTTLALRIGHRNRGEFPDGQLFVNLRGSVSPRDPIDILRELLQALGVAGFSVPDSVEQRAALYRSRLAGRRLLIVLDDAANEEQVRPLLPGSAPCAVILTSRHVLASLEGARHIRLGLLSEQQAINFMTAMIGSDRVDAEPEAARAIVRLCGGLPLALRIAGARLIARPDWSLSQLLKRLADESRRLTELETGDLGIRRSIELSYGSLSADRQRVFRLLSNLDCEAFPARVAAMVLGTSVSEAEDVLDQLVDNCMLGKRIGPDKNARYAYHDLMRLYGQEQSAKSDSNDERNTALKHALTGWLALAGEANRRLALLPVSIPPTIPQSEDVGHVTEAEIGPNPLRWLEEEIPALMSAMAQAHRLGLDELCVNLGVVIIPFFDWRGHFDMWREALTVMQASARRSKDARDNGAVLLCEGNLRESEGSYDLAKACFAAASKIFRELDDSVGFARALGSLALETGISGDLPGQRILAERALDLADGVGDSYGKAVALHHLALGHRDLGQPATGVSYARQAFRHYADLGCLFGQALTLSAEVWCLRDCGQMSEARRRNELWLQICTENNDRRGEAYALQSLAEIALRTGDLQAALAAVGTAWRLTEQIGWRLGRPHVLFTRGRLHHLSGNHSMAIECFQEAARLFEDAGERVWFERVQAMLADLDRSESD